MHELHKTRKQKEHVKPYTSNVLSDDEDAITGSPSAIRRLHFQPLFASKQITIFKYSSLFGDFVITKDLQMISEINK